MIGDGGWGVGWNDPMESDSEGTIEARPCIRGDCVTGI